MVVTDILLVGTNDLAVEIDVADVRTHERRSVKRRPRGTADMRWFDAAARDLGEHRCEQQRIRATDERYVDAAICAKLSLERLCRRHSGKAAAHDDDASRGRNGRLNVRGLWPEYPVGRFVQHLETDAHDEPKGDPRAELRQRGLHAIGRPLQGSARDEWNRHDIESNPKRDAQRCACHGGLDVIRRTATGQAIRDAR